MRLLTRILMQAQVTFTKAHLYRVLSLEHRLSRIRSRLEDYSMHCFPDSAEHLILFYGAGPFLPDPACLIRQHAGQRFVSNRRKLNLTREEWAELAADTKRCRALLHRIAEQSGKVGGVAFMDQVLMLTRRFDSLCIWLKDRAQDQHPGTTGFWDDFFADQALVL